MIRAGIVITLVGCNQLFDLQSTLHVDAAVQDGTPIDAALSCPPIGTVPLFAKALQQVVAQRCSDLTISFASGLALARCGAEISEGRINDRLSRAHGLVPPAGMYISQPRISPEGDIAFVLLSAGTIAKYSIYARGPDGTWTWQSDPAIPTNAKQISGPTRQPERHIIVRYDTHFDELVESGGTWTSAFVYTKADFGVSYLDDPRMTSDGLRLVFTGVSTEAGAKLQMMYADRANASVRFGQPVTLVNVPAVSFGAVLADDCSRMYFTALNSIFYQRQL